jgi:glucose-1-phosphate thymidylyltransferase
MNALLLAAGYATRLYPLTLHTPKPLLPVAGKPIAQYLVEQLETIPEIGRLLVVTNHRFAAQFQAWAAGASRRFQIEVVDDGTETNETRLGAIGDISFVLQRHPALRHRPLFVLGGDNLVDFRLGDLVAAFLARGGAATVIALVRARDPAELSRSGVAALDASGRVVEFVEKPGPAAAGALAGPGQDPSTGGEVRRAAASPPAPPAGSALARSLAQGEGLVCPPFYVFSPRALALLPEYLAAGEPPDAPGHFIAWLHRRTAVYGHVFAEARFDIGTPETYATACRLFEARASGGVPPR